MFRSTQPYPHNFKIIPLQTTCLHIHMCAQLQILKRFGMLTFLGYEIVGELHPSYATVGVHTFVTSADFHHALKLMVELVVDYGCSNS